MSRSTTSSTDASSLGHGRARGSGRTVVVNFLSDEFPAREVVDVDLTPEQLLALPGALSWCERVEAERGPRVTRIVLDPDLSHPDLPDLVFSLRDDSRDGIPTMMLTAHEVVPGLAPGTLVAPGDATVLGPPVGYLRWLVGSGEVHQVGTDPARRRRRVATRVLHAGELIAAAHGWPLLRGGSDRTALGHALLSSAPRYWRERLSAVRTWSAPLDT